MSDGHAQAQKDVAEATRKRLLAGTPHERIAYTMFADPLFDADIRAVVPDIEQRLKTPRVEAPSGGTQYTPHPLAPSPNH